MFQTTNQLQSRPRLCIRNHSDLWEDTTENLVIRSGMGQTMSNLPWHGHHIHPLSIVVVMRIQFFWGFPKKNYHIVMLKLESDQIFFSFRGQNQTGLTRWNTAFTPHPAGAAEAWGFTGKDEILAPRQESKNSNISGPPFWRPRWPILMWDTVGITIINHPFGNGLYQLSMVIWGMVYQLEPHKAVAELSAKGNL